MTLLIACLLLAQMNAGPAAYFATVLLWFCHLAAHSQSGGQKRR